MVTLNKAITDLIIILLLPILSLLLILK
jgi:hypothetical protein